MWEGFHSDEYLWREWQLSYRASNKSVRAFHNLLQEYSIYLFSRAVLSSILHRRIANKNFSFQFKERPFSVAKKSRKLLFSFKVLIQCILDSAQFLSGQITHSQDYLAYFGKFNSIPDPYLLDTSNIPRYELKKASRKDKVASN